MWRYGSKKDILVYEYSDDVKTVILLLALLAAGNTSAKLELGVVAPDFILLDVSSGEKVSLSDFGGQVVVLHFWKVCAGSCHEVVPLLNRLQSELLNELYPNLDEVQTSYGSLLKVLSVNLINPGKQVTAQIKKDSIKYQVLRGRNTGIAKEYQLITLPMLFIIDKDGFVRYISAFPKYDELCAEVARWIADILEE